jgi:hypothetical protein
MTKAKSPQLSPTSVTTSSLTADPSSPKSASVDAPAKPSETFQALAVVRKEGFWSLVTLEVTDDVITSRTDGQINTKDIVAAHALRKLFP